jgi:3-methyladenine DNA glycosylase AlkD
MQIETIILAFVRCADPERQEKLKTYIPSSMEVLGVRTPDLRKQLAVWWQEMKHWPPEKLIVFSKELVLTNIMECNHLAFELLWKNKKALDSLVLNDLEELGQHIDNWATTDSFSVMLSGWAWRNGQLEDRDILNWLATGNRWWRRAAVVSTVGLNLTSRGGSGDTRRTLMVCEKVVDDRDDMMVKALSWALRELSKSDPQAVAMFLSEYDNRLAGRVKREVTAKLTTGRKNG